MLRAGELGGALEVLGEAADLNLPFEELKDDGLGSAAAGLHRRLAGLDAEERFELLQAWSMPTESRPAVRVLTTITPTDAPPAVFARALGERPRESSFEVPTVGDVRGLCCTAWELVKAADDAGSLRRLTSELKRLDEDDVPNARFGLLLARIAAARRADQQSLDEFAVHAAALTDRSASAGLVTLPLAQRVWLFGSGRFDRKAERTSDFMVFPHWHTSRLAWCGGNGYPKTHTGWCLMKKTGGSPGTDHAAIRRWIAPTRGTIVISGELKRRNRKGNGIRGLVVSDRLGPSGDWTIQSGSIETSVEAVQVEQGDAIDFVVDCIDRDATFDQFSWTVRVDLQTNGGGKLTFDSVTGFHGPVESNADLAIAAACLTQEWLQPIGESILKTKLEQTYGPESLVLRPFLRYAHATVIQTRYGDAHTDVLRSSDLELWIPSSMKKARPSPQGSVRPIWLAHQDHILHATGPRHDYLFFKYPLTGSRNRRTAEDQHRCRSPRTLGTGCGYRSRATPSTWS